MLDKNAAYIINNYALIKILGFFTKYFSYFCCLTIEEKSREKGQNVLSSS